MTTEVKRAPADIGGIIMAVLNIGSGELDTTIGDAIAVVQDRDIIEVHAGTYINDHVSVSKHITVIPHSPDETAISGTFGTVFDYYSASYR